MAYYNAWPKYVPVAQRRAKAGQELEKLRKSGKKICPIKINGNMIAASFWGKGWCSHLESFSDYSNRLPRGRAYVRNGSVCHLEIRAGNIEAMVSGTRMYRVSIDIKPLDLKTWDAIKTKCQGQIGSVLELLQGKLSSSVMQVVCDRKEGLFPQPGEIDLKCSCPDWATMCKHVAAVLYGVGNRLDAEPELLFLLRGVAAEELISAGMALPTGASNAQDALDESGLADIFGVDMDMGDPPAKATPKKNPKPGVESIPKSTQKNTDNKKAAIPIKPKDIFNPDAPTGRAVAKLRKLSGLSIAEFARALEVSAPSIQRWESIPGPLRLQARPLAALTQMQKKLSDGS